MFTVFNLGIGSLIAKGDSKTQSPCEGFLAEGGLLLMKKRINVPWLRRGEKPCWVHLISFEEKYLHSLKLPLSVYA